MQLDDEPDRLPPTHLEALDDAMIIAAERFGEFLGGGRTPGSEVDRTELRNLYRALDRLVYEYATGLTNLDGVEPEVRAGQIIGTAALMSILARRPIGALGPAPLENELDLPDIGVVGGFGELVQVDPVRPWAGARWIVRTQDERRLPATLAMLMFDSSGVLKDAALDEHRAALRALVDASRDSHADLLACACALDWLLYDWLMAHRDGPDSGAVEVRNAADAAMIVEAAAASIGCRAFYDPELLRLPEVVTD